MRYVAAYMLAVMGGNPDPSAEDLINILASVGVEVDLENLNRVIKKLKGNDLEEVAEKGRAKLPVISCNRPNVEHVMTETENSKVADQTEMTQAADDSDDISSDEGDLGDLFAM